MKQITSAFLLLCLILSSCSNPSPKENNLAVFESLQAENDSLKNVLIQNREIMKNEISTFLTFQDNNAENAMNFYVDLFDNAEIIKVKRWGSGGPVEEGKIMHATFSLNGRSFMCSDSPPIHDWDFSPAISNYMDCESEKEQERLFTKLSENGTVTMPLNNYGFSQKFGWVIDQYGVSWQLNLP